MSQSGDQWARDWKAKRLAIEDQYGTPSQTFAQRVIEERGGQVRPSSINVDVGPNALGIIKAFHGSNAIFDTFKAGEFGFHFGTEQQAASLGDVRQFALDIKNPIPLKDIGVWEPKKVLLSAWNTPGVGSSFRGDEVKSVVAETDMLRKKLAHVLDQDEDMLAQGEAHYEWSRPVRDYLKSKGFDSISYQNESEGVGTSYIVFDPHQIVPIK